MDLGIEGRTALVTGGSLGIGRAVAAGLAAEGVDVAIVARDEERLRAVADELTSNAGGRVVAVRGDLSKAEDIATAVDGARHALGSIDILVNNAGSSPAGRLLDLDDETWMAAFELKFMGYMRLARALVPEMRARKWGRIVNVIGGGGHTPRAGYILGGSYNAALFNFTRALAKDCAPDDVLVNGVNPGPTDTSRWQSLLAQNAAISGKTTDEIEAVAVAGTPHGRVGRADEVADLIVFLCSERASHIAGHIADVDGASRPGL